MNKAMILIVGFVVVLYYQAIYLLLAKKDMIIIAMSLLVTKQITLFQQIRLLAE